MEKEGAPAWGHVRTVILLCLSRRGITPCNSSDIVRWAKENGTAVVRQAVWGELRRMAGRGMREVGVDRDGYGTRYYLLDPGWKAAMALREQMKEVVW